VRSAFFTERVVNVLNSLSCDSVDFSSLKSFQHSTRVVDLSGFCIGSTRLGLTVLSAARDCHIMFLCFVDK